MLVPYGLCIVLCILISDSPVSSTFDLRAGRFTTEYTSLSYDEDISTIESTDDHPSLLTKENSPWQDSTNSIVDRTKYLLSSKQNADVTIRVGNSSHWEKIKVHSLILGMSSPVFAKLLWDPVNLTNTSLLELTDMTVDAFNRMLSYMYEDDSTSSTMNETWDLWYAANKYQIKGLVTDTSRQIRKTLNITTVWDALKNSLIYEEKILEELCKKFIISSADKSFEHSQFLELDIKDVSDIISSPLLNIKEEKIFKAVLQWGLFTLQKLNQTETTTSLSEIISPLLSHIKFDQMTPDEFVSTVVSSKVLSLEEENKMLVKHLKYFLPSQVSTSTRKSSWIEAKKTICTRINRNSDSYILPREKWTVGEQENYLNFNVHCKNNCYFLGAQITESFWYCNKMIPLTSVEMSLRDSKQNIVFSTVARDLVHPFNIYVDEPLELNSGDTYSIYFKVTAPAIDNGCCCGPFEGDISANSWYLINRIATYQNFNRKVHCNDNIEITFSTDSNHASLTTADKGLMPTMYFVS